MAELPDVSCQLVTNLGQLISGEASEDHIQDNGLIKVQGVLRFEGIVTPPRGAVVQVAYARPQVGLITRFPRTLRVLRSHADPYRRVSTVDVGCRLTLNAEVASPTDQFVARQNRPVWYTSFDPLVAGARPPAGSSAAVAYDQLMARLRRSFFPCVNSQAVANYIVSRLGMTIAPGSATLTYNRIVDAVSFEDGYLNKLSDIIKSHRCIGFLNDREQLVIRRLSLTQPGVGPVLTDADILDLQQITGGKEPVGVASVTFAKAIYRS